MRITPKHSTKSQLIAKKHPHNIISGKSSFHRITIRPSSANCSCTFSYLRERWEDPLRSNLPVRCLRRSSYSSGHVFQRLSTDHSLGILINWIAISMRRHCARKIRLKCRERDTKGRIRGARRLTSFVRRLRRRNLCFPSNGLCLYICVYVFAINLKINNTVELPSEFVRLINKKLLYSSRGGVIFRYIYCWGIKCVADIYVNMFYKVNYIFT